MQFLKKIDLDDYHSLLSKDPRLIQSDIISLSEQVVVIDEKNQ